MCIKNTMIRPIASASVFVFFCCLLNADPAMGREEKKEVQSVVNAWAGKQLNKAHKAIDKKNFKEALELMNTMSGRRRINEYEKALMWQTYAYIYTSQEKMGKAIEAFEKCLATQAMPEAAALQIEYNLGQLYIASQKFRKAVAILTQWLGKVENPSPESKRLLAIAHVQLKQYSQALKYAKQAVAAVRAPKESWLQLLLSIHFEMKQLKKVAQILERIIPRFPKKNYWMQLAAVYNELGQEAKSLAVFELIYQQGMLKTNSELQNLISLYLQEDVPHKAAQVLGEEIKNGKFPPNEKNMTLLADSWLRARELDHAIEPLRAAAKLSTKGDLFVRLAQVFMEQEKWKKAAEALSSGIKKKEMTDRGNAHLLLGIIQFRSKSYNKARESFQKAGQFGNVSNSAKQWLKVVREKTGSR